MRDQVLLITFFVIMIDLFTMSSYMKHWDLSIFEEKLTDVQSTLRLDYDLATNESSWTPRPDLKQKTYAKQHPLSRFVKQSFEWNKNNLNGMLDMVQGDDKCDVKKKLYFLKIHKTASSVVEDILLRYVYPSQNCQCLMAGCHFI